MRTICFTSDYGLTDEFAGVCRGVVARIAPAVRVLDITHGIRPHDVLGAALTLRSILPYTPRGAVHLAVVDPGVGSGRRAIALRSGDDHLFVGPDNGLLTLAADAAGGVAEAISLVNSELWLTPVSRTFHGRDIFAPVAARLAAGLDFSSAGEPIDAAGLVRLSLPPVAWNGEAVAAAVIQVDGYGNASLGLVGDEVARLAPGPVELDHGGLTSIAVWGRTFSDVPAGDLVVYVDSGGWVALAVNTGSAADRLSLSVGSVVVLRPLHAPHGD